MNNEQRVKELQELYRQFIMDKLGVDVNNQLGDYMNFNGLKVGDIASPHTNDVNNVDYVTTTGKYIVKKLYKSTYGESIDIECVDFGDVYILESPSDFSVVCQNCGE